MSLGVLDSHTTVVTVNRRLARVLRGGYDRERLAAGERVWESPDILPYTAWLTRAWNEVAGAAGGPHPALLSAEQDISLWEQTVSDEARADGELPLVQDAQAARDAQSAWALLRAWRLRPEDDLGYANDEVRVFRRWARRYAARLDEGGWLEPAGVADRLAEGLTAAHLRPTRRLLLAGLEPSTPQQRALFSALEALGVEIAHWQPPSHAAAVQRYDFADPEEELAAAARWARRRVEEGAPGPVGIVVPGLAAVRDRVVAVFEDVLSPGRVRPGAPDLVPAFNVSLGRPLAQVPVVADALAALGGMSGRLSLTDAGRWLLSPYLGGGQPGWRARFDAELRRIGEPRYTLARLEALARVTPDAPGPAPRRDAGGAPFADLVARLRDRAGPDQARLEGSAWAAAFSAWLRDAGWPGERTLTSEEFQAVQGLRELLGTFAALSPVLAAMGRAEALVRLAGLAARQIFQPRTGAATVQILGVLEAACIDYSHLWITGLHDRAWPEPPRPNPFLPVALQRAHGMPRAGSEQQLARARDWTARMLASAGEVIVSHPRREGDEALRPSALIAGIAPGGGGPSTSAAVLDAESIRAAAPVMEMVADDVAPGVAGDEAVGGGVSVFKDQSACPFRAFAVHRLHAVDVTAPESSLDPRVRGNLAHRLLELLWQSLGAQSRLLAMSADERRELVASTARRVLAEEARRRPDTLRGHLLAIEQRRLEALAEAWLAIEAGRPPFRVDAERSATRTVAGLPVTLRPDRIDRLDSGEILLIDYKTGRCNPADWFGDRPDEPQLPVYALAVDDLDQGRVAGLAFGVLRPGELGYRGLGREAGLAPGVAGVAASRTRGAREAGDWEAHMGLWRERLARLARAYLDGDARVDPKAPGTTCRNCGLEPLCRIHER